MMHDDVDDHLTLTKTIIIDDFDDIDSREKTNRMGSATYVEDGLM